MEAIGSPHFDNREIIEYLDRSMTDYSYFSRIGGIRGERQRIYGRRQGNLAVTSARQRSLAIGRQNFIRHG
jgi:hypothetical protein